MGNIGVIISAIAIGDKQVLDQSKIPTYCHIHSSTINLYSLDCVLVVVDFFESDMPENFRTFT